MGYAIIGICILVAIILGVAAFQKQKKTPVSLTTDTAVSSVTETTPYDQKEQNLVIQMEMLPAEDIPDESKLVEITDSKVLVRINNLVPGLAQAGNAANNAAQAIQGSGEVLYRAIIPAGAKLTDSKAMDGAVRGIYHGADGIKGHANLVAVEAQKGTTAIANTAAAAMGVASMVVGQYYMTQINTELGMISDGISKISDFQDDEYIGKLSSLIGSVKKITDNRVEILENDELRHSEIFHLISLEDKCTDLLDQANSALQRSAKKTGLEYGEYEKEVNYAQKWFVYQKVLMDVLYKISELRHALHLGTVSKEYCASSLRTSFEQVSKTQQRLTNWHLKTIKRLNIDVVEARRKREGIDGVVHSVPGFFKDDFNFRAIEKSTAEIIDDQVSGHDDLYHQDTIDLYAEDVHLIAKNGKIYYLPEPEK